MDDLARITVFIYQTVRGPGQVVLERVRGKLGQREAQLLRELFRLEESLSPVSVMLWYQIIGWIGDLADQAEKVGNRIRLLIAR